MLFVILKQGFLPVSVSTHTYCSLRCFFLVASTPPSASFSSSLASRHSYLRGHKSLPLHFILNGPPLIRPLPSLCLSYPSICPSSFFLYLPLKKQEADNHRGKKKKKASHSFVHLDSVCAQPSGHGSSIHAPALAQKEISSLVKG